MKLKPVAVANALCLTAVFLYVLCWVLAVAAPSLCHWAYQGWFHWLNASPLVKPESPDYGPARLVTGFLSLFATTWIAGWLFATMYNELSKPWRRAASSQAEKPS